MKTLGRKRWLVAISTLSIVASLAFGQALSTAKAKKKKHDHSSNDRAVLWSNPGDMRRRDLYYGPGSRAQQPAPPFRFIKEVKEGSNPKFEVEDARGAKWRVKLGPEAQSETAASRLVWAAGYNAEEAYYLDHARIDGLKLSRGQKYITGDVVRGARFEPRRKDVERGQQWGWNKNPFKNTRELNGLKTMMVMLNNWDTFKKNNRVLHDKSTGEARYTVTDLGATLGAANGIGARRSKGDVNDFARDRLVKKVDKNGKVKFDYDLKPKGLAVLSMAWPPYLFRQRKATNSMQNIPVEHAAWIGGMLSQLSDDQLRDSFRAAGYDRATTDAYVRTMRGRINELNRLRDAQLASRPRRTR